jgi:CRISPR/Cas system-associated exonuclease Cas4 (RecB family)
MNSRSEPPTEQERTAVSCTGAALAAVASAHPYERRLLVCARPAHGRELLRAMAYRGVAWSGIDVRTAQQVAHELMAPDLALEQLEVIDEFDELALLDEAMDEVLGNASEGLAELAEGFGLRQAVVHAVRALRLAGVGEAALERARFRDEHKRAQIARILAVYERELTARRRVDGAGVMRRAVAALAMGSVPLPYDRVWILPGQARRGLAGQMLDVLLERGASVLPADPVYGLPRPAQLLDGADAAAGAATRLAWLHAPGSAPPDVEGVDIGIFTASSTMSELREVLRRVLAAGLRWDDVEIIATDANVYGVALDGLARRLGIPVSYATGLPVSRTRPGRAVAKYLEWIQTGFPADVLREMLERGDVAPPETSGVTGVAAARLLRRMKVGRGRDRYAHAIARLERALERSQSAEDERSPGEFAEQRARERAELDALIAIVQPLLAETPVLPTPDTAHATLSPAALARGLVALLERVPARHSVDRTARDRLLARAQRIAATLQRETTLEGAIAVVLSKLDERVPAPEEPGSAPWTASGGYLHLSDLEHGGNCGRRATFIVGLDAARFPGGRFNDALLVDDDRRRIIGGTGMAALPLAAERIEERRWSLAALVARLRGSVTFSYAAWDAVEGRAVAPASELLQVFRLVQRNATADYDELHDALSPAASPIPQASGRLDADDVWFGELSHGGRLRSGVQVVLGVHGDLKAGVQGYIDRAAPEPNPRHGIIRPRPALDPRNAPDRVISATQLQSLGTCPHRYLLRYVLHVRPPDDPELSSEEWLSALDRGALMHRVYERALSAARDERITLSSDAFEDRVLSILDEETARQRDIVPPPGDGIFRMECELLAEDARAFVAMVREDGERYIALEQKFGRDGADAVPVTLPDGSTVNVSGAIDRVDRIEDGRLVVIDYKTGRRTRFGARNGAYDGGRRLQHVLYAAVARTLFGAEVARAEYHFPTRASENYRAVFERDDLEDGVAVIGELLDMAAAGTFVPTNEPEDCGYCDFAAICRVKAGSWGKHRSPLAEWSRDVDSDVLELLRRLRR